MIIYKPIMTKKELKEIQEIVLNKKEEVLINSPLKRAIITKENQNLEKAYKINKLLLQKTNRKIYNIMYSIYSHMNYCTLNNTRSPWISFIKDQETAFKLANLKQKEIFSEKSGYVDKTENRRTKRYQQLFSTNKYNQGIYILNIDESKIITDLSLMTDKEILSKLDSGYLIDLGTKENFEYLKERILRDSPASEELMNGMKKRLINGLIHAYEKNELLAYKEFKTTNKKFKYIDQKKLSSIETLDKEACKLSKTSNSKKIKKI